MKRQILDNCFPAARSLFHTTALFILSIIALGPHSPAQAASTPTHKEQSGTLPKSGTIAIRSGLQWMNESSPLFQELKAEAEPMLTARGLDVMEVPESTLAAMPNGRDGTGGAQNKAGKGMKLKSYSEIAGAGASSTMRENVPQTLFFAQTQHDGTPIMFRGGRIPGRIPPEVSSHDAENLDYVIICRVAAVSPGYVSEAGTDGFFALPAPANQGLEAPFVYDGPDSFVTAAGTVQGVGTLGYGSSMPAAPPRSGYGGTPGDYARGYEGNSPVPGDPWHREADMKARDYQLKNSPPPISATPPADGGRSPSVPASPPTPSLPKPPLPGDTDMPAVSPGPAPSRPAPVPATNNRRSGGETLFRGKKPAIAGYALEMECLDLKPVKAGKQPKVVWRCTVQQRADKASLSAALPGMLRVAFGAKAK